MENGRLVAFVPRPVHGEASGYLELEDDTIS